MKSEFTLRISPDGSVTGIYQDSLAEVLGAVTRDVRRVSLVEWDRELWGWTVKSARNEKVGIVELQVGHSFVGSDGYLKVFETREAALAAEEQFFWQLTEVW